jgi:hypothetical protein
MLTTSTHIDLAVACDHNSTRAARLAAWERYEVDCWFHAYKDRGLLIRNMDNSCIGLDGESMQMLVSRRMRLPEVSGAQTEWR